MTNTNDHEPNSRYQQKLRSKNKALLIALSIMIIMLYTLALVRLKGSF